MVKIPFWAWLVGALVALIVLGTVAVLFRHSNDATSPHKANIQPVPGLPLPTLSNRAPLSEANDVSSAKALNQITTVPTPSRSETRQPEVGRIDVTDTFVPDKPLSDAKSPTNSVGTNVAQNGDTSQIRPPTARPPEAPEAQVSMPTPAAEVAPPTLPQQKGVPAKGQPTSVMIPLPSRK